VSVNYIFVFMTYSIVESWKKVSWNVVRVCHRFFVKRNTYFHIVKLLLKYTYANLYQYVVKTEGRIGRFSL
jgi:hypothetical protein